MAFSEKTHLTPSEKTRALEMVAAGQLHSATSEIGVGMAPSDKRLQLEAYAESRLAIRDEMVAPLGQLSIEHALQPPTELPPSAIL